MSTVKLRILKGATLFLCMSMIAIVGIFMHDQQPLIYFVSVGAFALCAIAIAPFETREKPIRVLFITALCLSLLVAAYIVLERTDTLSAFTDFEQIKRYILSTGKWGVLVFVALTIFQVVVLPIPAPITILIGVAIYGSVMSFILSTIGTIIGSVISFALGKIFGKRLICWMVGKETTEKYAELLNKKGRFLFVLMLLFPVFPDDMLCMVAGMTAMTYKYFFVACCLTRPVMIAFTCFLGSGNLIPFEGWGIPVWIALFCIMIVGFIFLTVFKERLFKRRKK